MLKNVFSKKGKLETYLKNEAGFNGPKRLQEHETLWLRGTKEIDIKDAEMEKRLSERIKISQTINNIQTKYNF